MDEQQNMPPVTPSTSNVPAEPVAPSATPAPTPVVGEETKKEEQHMGNQSVKGMLSSVDAFLGDIFKKKMPPLSAKIREVLVKIAPWVTIIAVVFSIPAILAAFGLGSFLRFSYGWGMGMGYGMYYGFSFAILFLAISSILYLLALPGLFGKKLIGWNYMFYATLVNLVYNLICVNLFSLVVGGAISLYFLYQVKEYYK